MDGRTPIYLTCNIPWLDPKGNYNYGISWLDPKDEYHLHPRFIVVVAIPIQPLAAETASIHGRTPTSWMVHDVWPPALYMYLYVCIYMYVYTSETTHFGMA